MFNWKAVPQTVIRSHAGSPRVYRMRNGTLIAAAETREGIRVFSTEDDGRTWHDAGPGSFTPELSCANPEFFEPEDGVVLLAHRAIGKRELYLHPRERQ